MKKAISMVLVILLLLTFYGCTQTKPGQNTILGIWEIETDLSILGLLQEDAEKGQTVAAMYRFEFLDDGSGKATITVVEPDIEQNLDSVWHFDYKLTGEKLELFYEHGSTQVFTISFSEGNLIMDGRVRMELVRK